MEESFIDRQSKKRSIHERSLLLGSARGVPFSHAPFCNSLIIRENTGNFTDLSDFSHQLLLEKSPHLLGFLAKFPSNRNREY
jgi:hypothetical protein